MRIKPKKRLGQNFLTSKDIQKKIIRACEFKARERVLEIGAGTGDMTSLIAPCVSLVCAVEVDLDLITLLRERFKGCSNVRVCGKDILKFNINRHFPGEEDKIKVVGNIPYYISSAIIEHLFAYRKKIGDIFITVQKEFAQRVAASPGSKEYGAFSCYAQYFSVPSILFRIKKNCFTPSPSVDSCLLRMRMREDTPLGVKNEELFFGIIRAAFNQRRKTLRNSLKNIVPLSALEEFFGKYAIDRNIRPEDLSLREFAGLANLTSRFSSDG